MRRGPTVNRSFYLHLGLRSTLFLQTSVESTSVPDCPIIAFLGTYLRRQCRRLKGVKLNGSEPCWAGGGSANSAIAILLPLFDAERYGKEECSRSDVSRRRWNDPGRPQHMSRRTGKACISPSPSQSASQRSMGEQCIAFPRGSVSSVSSSHIRGHVQWKQLGVPVAKAFPLAGNARDDVVGLKPPTAHAHAPFNVCDGHRCVAACPRHLFRQRSKLETDY